MRLIETMRAEWGGAAYTVPLLRRHLLRLGASAEAWGYAYDEARVRVAISEAVDAQPAQAEPLRIRLTLGPADPESSPGQAVHVEASRLVGDPMRTIWICPDPLLEAGGPLCVHKTTTRDHYETPYLAALAHGADEAILVDARGEVVEGTRTTVWIRRGRDLVTPPLAAGGLPGVARGLLLDTLWDTREETLTPADLRAAEAIYVSNAVRGLARVRLVESAPGTAE